MEAIPFSIEKYNDLVVNKGMHVVYGNGQPTRILCTDRKNSDEPIVGLRFVDDCTEIIDSWKSNSSQLLIIPKPPVSLGWVAIFQRGPHGEPYTVQPCKTRDGLLKLVIDRDWILLSEPTEIFAKP